MDFSHGKVIHQIRAANSVADAIQVLEGYNVIAYATFHLIRNVQIGADNPFVRTGYPAEWVSHYLLNNYVTVDPVVLHARSTEDAFFWSEIHLDEAGKRMMEEAARFNIGRSGYSIPYSDKLGRSSLLSLNSHLDQEPWRDFVEGNRIAIGLLARELHSMGVAEAFIDAGSVPHLSPRERECLKWISLGKSHAEIAVILSLSEHTIRSYLKMARTKLDSNTLAQAVTKATRLGLI